MKEIQDGTYICKINKIENRKSKTDKEICFIEFEITDESLAPTYFSINDRSMNELELYSLIKKVFETYELDSNKVTPAN